MRSYLPECFYLRTSRGSLALIFAGEQFARHIDPVNNPAAQRSQTEGALRHDIERVLDDARRWAARRPTGYGTTWQAMGFEVIAYDMRSGYFVLVIPFWAICLPLAGLTLWACTRWRRQQAWQRPGRCHNCGYDVRASADRCPECGTAVPQNAGVRE